MTSPDASNFAKVLDQYLPDNDSVRDKASPAVDRRAGEPGVERLPIQARLDLHGQTLAQARRSVDNFLKASASQGLRKVLIIHGKGAGILQLGVSRYLEGHPLAGRRHPARREDGGTGALIVLIRQK